ncbi:Ger(x)C family spore germination protein [Priestia megaterium]|uniref:Ger(x)C family spore germination protein n=1 Tax=Priestia megaterium TaxID=1404 RepID=UPI000BF4D72E|nr:Ger(x)C family spore germination protein [Priestia megaterium]PFE35847.1 spore gernimation protein GerA [Priestia megaterium]
MKRILILCTCLTFLTSCADRETIDEIQVVNSIGYDYIPQSNKVRGTILYPIYKYGPTEEPSIIAATANSSFDIPLRLNNKSSLPVAFGQLRSIVMGKEFATHGVEELVNTIARNPDLGRNIKLSIVDGNAHELLSSVTKKKIKDYQFISNLIEQNIRTENLPNTNLQIFLFSFFSDDRDPYLPVLAQEKDAIKLKGLALFKEQKVVTTIGMKETFLFKLLTSGTKHGRYSVKIKESDRKGEIILQNLRTKTKYEIKGNHQHPSIVAHLTVDGLVKEFPGWIDLTDPASIKMVEKILQKDIEKDGDAFIKKLQQHKIDPICFTDYVRSKTRGFNSEKFKSQYPDMNIEVKSRVHLIQTGISN